MSLKDKNLREKETLSEHRLSSLCKALMITSRLSIKATQHTFSETTGKTTALKLLAKLVLILQL